MKFRLLLLSLFSAVFFAVLPQPSYAQNATSALINPAGTVLGIFNDVQDYCKSRQGNTVNLETWYSGKCPSDSLFSTITGVGQNSGVLQTGEYRGFSDIVILDLITKILPENPLGLFGLGSNNKVNSTAAIPTVTSLMGMITTNPPASFSNYLAYVGNNIQKANLVQPAYAQNTGFGFSKLAPILPAWKGIRNITYLVFVLVFIVYGFMLMFRVKIDPKVSTSIELALPKIVITLLAITFSYAIAGLVIDLSLVIPAMIVGALQSAKLIDLGTNISFLPNLSKLLESRDAVKYVTGQATAGSAILNLQLLWELIVNNGVTEISSLFSGIPAGLATTVVLFVPNLIITLILLCAFLYVIVKVFFMMVQSYAKIILNIIFAPLILLGNVLPGSDSIGGWLRGLLAEISIFPTVTIVTMLAISFLGDSVTANGSLWTPPNFQGTGDILGAAGVITPEHNVKGAMALLAYGLFLLLPKLADIVKEALGMKAFKYGSAIGEGLMFGPSAAMSGINLKQNVDKAAIASAQKRKADLDLLEAKKKAGGFNP